MLTTRNESILWLILLFVAAFLRLAPIAASLPYIDYVDEGYALHQTIHLLNQRTLDTAWYGYPSLPAYLTAAALLAWDPIYREVHGHSFRNDVPREEDAQTASGYNYDLIAPSELILAGRLIAAALSIGTVALAGMIAFRLWGRLAGLLALLFASLCPALVLRGSNVIVDTFATFFALLALWFCERFQANDRRALLFVAASGFAAGLAFSSKYTAGAVFVAVLFRVWTLGDESARLRFSLVATAGLSLAILAGAPATLSSWRAVWHDMAVTAGNYRMMQSSPGYFGQAVAAVELGWLVAVAGMAGLVLMLRTRPARSTALAWSLFAFTLLAIFLGNPFQPFRNLLPLAPLICISAAIAFSQMVELTRRSRWGLAVAFVLIGATAASSVSASLPLIRSRTTHRDSRVQAIEWLRERVPKNARVLIVRELSILPAQCKRTGADISVVALCDAAHALEAGPFDYIVTGDFDARHAVDRGAGSACVERWKEKNAPLIVAAEFGSGPAFVAPYVWRTNDERIVVLRPNGSD